jgi:phosphosulfolactate synthase (CoM biosynthesis protein A)
MRKQQKGGTADLRSKLIKDMVSNVEKLCNNDGYTADKTLINKYVQTAVDHYIKDWYEVSLEAMDLMEGGADFVTDEKIDDPELIKEAKRRIVKVMYEERPTGLQEHIAASIIHAMNSDPQETDIRFEA